MSISTGSISLPVFIQRIRQFHEKYISQPNLYPTHGLRYWQERIVGTILLIGVPLGFIVYIPSVLLSIKEDRTEIVVIDTLFIVCAIILLLFRRLPYGVRSAGIVAICYLIGLILLLVLGPFGAGPVWLFAAPIFAGAFGGQKASVTALFINAATCTVFGLMISTGSVSSEIAIINPIGKWIVISLNFMLLNSVAALGVSLVLKRLQTSLEQEKEFRMSLDSKHKELVITQKDLEHELVERNKAERKIKDYSENLERIVTTRTEKLKIARNDAERTRDRIDAIIKSVADGLIVTDLNNNIILINLVAEKMFDVSLNKAINQPIEFVLKDSNLCKKISDTLESPFTGYVHDFELPGKNQKKPQIMSARLSTIYAKGKKTLGVVTIISDVTKEREIDRMKTEFISTSAHELRTPLTSIQGFSEILLTRDNLDDKTKNKYLQYINSKSVLLGKIINDLLNISRIESGEGFGLIKEKCLIKDIIETQIPHFEAMSPKHTFDVVFPEQPIELFVDVDKIEQVMTNLLSNAVKYSPDGGKILITADIGKEFFNITIEDKGIGMTQEQVDKIFDKFYRADASNTSIEGTGLGMSIVQDIVEAHEGKIFIKSKPGIGTVVKVSIPLEK